MKKLMIAAAIVCAAALSQAASVEWSSGTVWGPADNTELSFADASVKIGANGIMNIFAVNADAFAAATADSIIADYAGKTGDIAGNVASDSNKYYFKTTDKYSAGNEIYALILMQVDGTEDGETYYIANKTYNKIGSMGDTALDATNGKMDTIWGGNNSTFEGSGTAITQWTAAPEPTSGLLLLLGVAGLALRRRRA